MKINPYTPGAGTMPNFLAGRDDTINYANMVLEYIRNGRTLQSCIYYGLRGVGKTVLLNSIEELAEAKEFICEHIEISENDNFKLVIAQYLRKIILQLSRKEKAKEIFKKALGVLKAFTLTIEGLGDISIDVDALIGVADSGNFQNDLTELFTEVGKLAKQSESMIAIFIDEIQYIKSDDFEALIGATHRISQKCYPITIFGAGLPKVIQMAANAKSYAERLFQFIPIGGLKNPNDKLALAKPAQDFGVNYDPDALDQIIKITEGYPYFIQEFGSQIWGFQNNDKIDIEAVEKAYPLYIEKLDNSFFRARLDRITPNEKKYIFAMARTGVGPYETSLVASALNKNQQQVALDRSNLIAKGLIYQPHHGFIDFTVPKFNEFLERQILVEG